MCPPLTRILSSSFALIERYSASVAKIAGDVHVTVRAAYPDGFLGSLCNEIRSLVEQFWKGLDCRLSVPCHAPCKGLHELEELVETKREGMPKVRCSVCKKFYEIDSLLVAATPKLPMNVVLTELKKVKATLADMKKAQEELGSDIKQMIGQANEQFELLMNAMTSLAKDGLVYSVSSQSIQDSGTNQNGSPRSFG